jgi:hypothetical protein
MRLMTFHRPMPRRTFGASGAAVLAVAAALVISQVPAFAALARGSVGYDIGYPQCGVPASSYPTASFGIVGVNAGYPFTYYNQCLAYEYANTSNPSLYINTGYDPSYTNIDATHSTSQCVTVSASIIGSPDQQRAWAVGCSEASRSLAYAASQGAAGPGSLWLDVETANSWCGQPGTACTDLSLNQYTLQGIVDTLHAGSSAAVGAYSTSYQWNAILGFLAVSGIQADWVATGATSPKRARASCSRTFSGAAVQLVQYASRGFDGDYAC